VNQPPKAKLLLADDEPLYLQVTSELLRKAGYSCTCVSDAPSAIAVLQNEPIDLVLTDLNMPGNLKLELLRAGRQTWPDVPLLVITGVPSLPTAIESVRLGIADYLVKPVKFDVLLQSIERVLRSSPRAGAADSSGEGAGHSIIGSSEPIRTLLDLISRVAQSDANVLISGESGTGKELVATAIHRASARRENHFQVIDCTAIPESLFESVLFGHVKGSFTGAVDNQLGLLARSDGGTAFFDEIGELPMTVQPKLLRVIQEQTFVPVGKSEPVQLNTRFLCATNRNLLQEVEAGRFRRDLFYRLSVLHLELPPLRRRGEDVIELAEHFLQQLKPPTCQIAGFTDACLDRLMAYQWPGNVRELRNAIESSVALCRSSRIDVSDLPEALASAGADASGSGLSAANSAVAGELSREEVLGSTDKRYFEALLKQYHGNISRAARHAGLSRQALHKLLNKHRISAAPFRGPR
jgi:DNA-binding NtrC family response regulator